MENFNLKKFLVENKLTANSRVLNEENTSIDYEKLKQILLLACNTHPAQEDEITLYEKNQVKSTLKYIMKLEKGVKDDNFDIFDELEGQEPATFEGTVYLDDTQKTKWDDFDTALSVLSGIAYEYDLDDAAAALNGLAQAVSSFKLAEEPIQEEDVYTEDAMEADTVGDGYVEAMGDQFEDACDQLVQAWEAWKNGPETVEEDIEGAKADVLAYIKRKLR